MVVASRRPAPASAGTRRAPMAKPAQTRSSPAAAPQRAAPVKKTPPSKLSPGVSDEQMNDLTAQVSLAALI